ncbi:hypothetical protein O0I10_006268 [Lichtheimia ornata]|uniref:Uncharacterized protein n=1 Tax=Lichtheimia ornata TaxID=688661 RepID=A0AAD7Y120_9FUNG|nr:uncharacterized protein O0I10_006268 [Lichtheimia ornata]KAJ8657997.1 hypothetical protein O0I10_006268 [Lichtheimia ornata]
MLGMVKSILCESIKLELVNSNFWICGWPAKKVSRGRPDFMAKLEIDEFDPETGTQGCLSWAEHGGCKKSPCFIESFRVTGASARGRVWIDPSRFEEIMAK